MGSTNKDIKTVIIFGAGIAGLSAAHELAEKGWQVQVYETLSEPGGVARSKREANGAPSEYSWRGYGPWYHNVFAMMKKIPLDSQRTVFDDLSKPIEFYFTHNGDVSFRGLSGKDYLRVALETARNAAACPARIADYATINAADYLKPRMTAAGWKQFTAAFGPWVGIDPQRASLHHIMSFYVKNLIPGPPAPYRHVEKDGEKWTSGRMCGWSVFKQPSNESWFDPWVRYLKKLGVSFHFNCSLEALTRNRSKITAAVVNCAGQSVTLRADQYILAISPFAASNVIQASRLSSKSYPGLVQDGPHIQISFRIGFSKKVKWPGERRAVILTDSEFNITMYRQDELWKGATADLGQELQALWSGTACISYRPGKLYGRPMRELTKDEFKREIFYQLARDSQFNRELLKANGTIFTGLPIVYFEVWNSWQFGGCGGVTTSEPKYVDSTNTRVYQPNCETDYSNLWMAGGHTRTSAELWSMEAAAESGRRAAAIIAGSEVITQQRGAAVNFLTKIDRVLYQLRLPNVIDVLLGLLVIMVLIGIVFIIASRS